MDESTPGAVDDQSSRRRGWWAVAVVVALGIAAGVPLALSLNQLETVQLDPDSARSRLAGRSVEPSGDDRDVLATPTEVNGEDTDPSAEPTEPDRSAPPDDDIGRSVAAPAVGDHGYRTFLVIGSDERAGLGGSRADVIVVGMLPEDGSHPVMFSLPRDLWLPDPCRGGHQRINAAYNGCGGVANGFELTSIVVEDFTGIEVDHVAAIDFEGFKQVINAVGGVQICVDNAVRDGALSLPAGCTMADGEQALAWVRSRKTQELVDGQWRTMPGVNDLTRNQRQQQLMLQLLGRVGSFGTVSNLYGFAEGVSDSVTLGAGLNALDGARLAWSMRGRAEDIQQFSIPVTGMTTSAGAQVLLPTEPFAETFANEVGVDLQAAD